MKWWVALLLLPLGSVAAQGTVSRGFAVSPTVSLRIWLPAGRVQVMTWEHDSIRVTGTVAKGSTFFGGGSGTAAKFGVEQSDPASSSLARGEFVVTVPMRAQVWIKSTDATIESWRTLGDLEILTVAGQVHVVDARGVVTVETIDAPIRVRGAVGTVRLHSGGGALMLRDVSGDLTASTVRGTIDIASESLGDGRLETVDGHITLTGRLRPGAFLDVQSHAGTVDLQLPLDAVPSLELASRAGEVRNALGAGNPKFGRILVRSFKGAINATGRRDVEGGKPKPSL
ncbi:MAG: DUF4097 family beta strand repeat-containing protein [Gemmatimonadota bacterium]